MFHHLFISPFSRSLFIHSTFILILIILIEHRLPRFRDKKQQLTTPKVGEEVPYDPPLPSTVHVWDSGPTLVANQSNRESINYNVPGEGKVLRTLEEGSRVWKNKTVRTYHETVPKNKQITNSRTNDDTLQRKSIQHSSNNNNNNNNSSSNNNNLTSVTGKTSRCDDDKVASSKLQHDSRVSHHDTLIKRKMSPSPNRRVIVSPSTNINYDCTPRYLYTSHSRLNSPDRHSNLSSVSHRLVPMEDKSIQCNLKKELKDQSKKYDLRDDFKVIKSNTRDGSVSVFSDVSLLDEDENKKKDLRKETVVYSTIETHTPTETIKTREMSTVSREKDYLYRDRNGNLPLRDRTIDVTRSISRPTSRSDYSPSPTRTRVVTKTYGVNMATDMAPDVTRSSPLHAHRNDSSYRSTTPRSWHQDVSPVSPRNNEMVSPSRSRNIAHETIEETISISNASSDELIDNHHQAHARAVESVLLNDSSNVHNVSSSTNTATLLNDRTKRSNSNDINGRELLSSSRISDSIDPRGVSSASPRNYSANNSSLWFNKPVDEDYRKSMVASPLDVVGNTIGVKDDHERFCSATLNRREPHRNLSSNSHEMRNHSATGDTVHAYTLDRKHLDRRKKALSTFGGSHLGSNGVSFEPLGGPPGFRKAPSLPEKESTPGIRRFASTRDISGYQSEAGASASGHGYRRGGLAAAFKERQARASSLNRSIERNYHGSSVSLAPHSTTGNNLRNNYSQEFRPRTRSFHDSHDQQPAEVHYVPIKTADGGAPLNRHQSILQKKHEAKLASKSKEQRSSPGVVTFASHGKQYSVHPSTESDEIERKKKDLKRSQSIPKDTKFPWLARLKMKVKARDP